MNFHFSTFLFFLFWQHAGDTTPSSGQIHNSVNADGNLYLVSHTSINNQKRSQLQGVAYVCSFFFLIILLPLCCCCREKLELYISIHTQRAVSTLLIYRFLSCNMRVNDIVILVVECRFPGTELQLTWKCLINMTI